MAACQTARRLQAPPDTHPEDPSIPTATESPEPGVDPRAEEVPARDRVRDENLFLTIRTTWDSLWRIRWLPDHQEVRRHSREGQLRAIFCRPLGQGWWVLLLLFTNLPLLLLDTEKLFPPAIIICHSIRNVPPQCMSVCLSFRRDISFGFRFSLGLVSRV